MFAEDDQEFIELMRGFVNKGIAENEYLLLMKRARMHKGPFLNIGTAEGCSVFAMAHANPEAIIYTVDPYNLYWEHAEPHNLSDYLNLFKQHVDNYGLFDRIKLNIMSSDQFFDTNPTKFELIFIDGNHEYEYVLRDIKNSWRRLPIGGSLVLHDVAGEPGVTHAVMNAFANPPLEIEVKAGMTAITRDNREI